LNNRSKVIHCFRMYSYLFSFFAMPIAHKIVKLDFFYLILTLTCSLTFSQSTSWNGLLQLWVYLTG